jgi:hypothetical protein
VVQAFPQNRIVGKALVQTLHSYGRMFIIHEPLQIYKILPRSQA